MRRPPIHTQVACRARSLRRISSAAVAWLVVGVTAVGHGRADGQSPPASPEAHLLVRRADSLHAAFDVLGALGAYDSILSTDADNVGVLWRAARECVAMGLMAEGTTEQNRWFTRGEAYAERATNREPGSLAALYWLLSAKGHRAVQSDPLTTARLATDVHDLAHIILRADPQHAGATNALGVLNYEVMKLSRVKRFIGQRILGSRAFDGTSWENAEAYLTRATQLDPDNALYLLDLGKLHLLRDDPDQARQALHRVLLLDDREPTDPTIKAMAAELLTTSGSR